MSEKQPLEEAFFELLKKDINLLGRSDELNELLDETTQVDDMWNFRALKKVLSLNIGQKILPAIDSETELKNSIENVREILKTEEIKEDRINYILELIENTIKKVKAAKLEEEKILAEQAANIEEPVEEAKEEVIEKSTEEIVETPVAEDSWFCQNCGQKNTGKFCANCGTSKDGIQPQYQNFSKVSLEKTAPAQETPVQPTVVQEPPIQKQTVEPPEPQEDLSEESSDNKKNILLIAAGLVICFLIGFLIKSSGDSNKTPQPTASESNINVNKSNNTSSTKTNKTSELQKPKPASAPGELAFGEIYIGQPESEVRRILGAPNKISTPNGATHPHHEYDDITVIISDGKVSGFISQSNKYASKRGMYEGVSRADVEKAYGKSEHAFTADGYDIIMEYPFVSEDNRPCLLRFAIKNDKVYYVSARIWIEEEDRQEAKSPDAAREVFVNYHQAITDRKFNLAFSSFTKDRQSRFNNSWQKFAQGYGSTLTSKVLDLKLLSSNGDEAVFAYRLLARDKANNGVIRRTFDGKVTMRFENGAWKIAETESKKVSESRE